MKYIGAFLLIGEAIGCLWLAPRSLEGLSREEQKQAWLWLLLAVLFVAMAIEAMVIA